MSNTLVIVESPSKAKTIEKYLGKGYKVLASYGHVRDLLPKNGGVKPEENFAMHYEPIERSQKHVDNITKALKKSDALLIATDPDREGEAIAWHLVELLKETAPKALGDKPVHRIVFNQITKNAIRDALDAPRDVALPLVNAQQARRALDFLVGFRLSPLLWRKIRRGLSAGRVQSPALRLIVEREEAIEAFKVEEYWSITAALLAEKTPFKARLTQYEGNKVEQFSFTNAEQAETAQQTLLKAANGELVISKVERKQRKRNPAPPFITSTLQQEGARKLGFTAKRTMMLAQQLYEAGHITYMRTDSVSLANEALDDLREVITKKYGADHLPKEARRFKTKSKNAQEAHEAIRPTAPSNTPTILKESLDASQFKLYELIWKRTLASQMIHATIDTVAVDLDCGQDHRFRANGSTVKNPGFLSVYREGHDEPKTEDDENMLPPLEEGQKIKLSDILPNQHFTEPPPRYTEASLVKSLEELGIGRPSTYASIISTLQAREYVELEQKRFHPTDTGRVVSKFLTEHFTRYVDFGFTANLEDELDAVARGEEEWLPLLERFWLPFNERLTSVDKEVSRADVTQEATDKTCPTCEKPLTIRLGRRGRFLGCSGYPDCKYTSNLDGENSEPEVPETIDRQCPDCESDLIIRHGRYGKFIGCSAYPKCRFIEPLEKPKDCGVECPKCKQGSLLQRRSRRGKIFYSCGRYPDCDYAIWNEPVAEPCPDCQWPLLTIKTTKRKGREKVCPQKECGFSMPDESAEDA